MAQYFSMHDECITVRKAPMDEIVINISNLGSVALSKEVAAKLGIELIELSD